MNFGNREITQAIVTLLKSIYPSDMVVPYAVATTVRDEKYPSVTYFIQMVGDNKNKKDVNSFTRTVIDGLNVDNDTPNYITFQIQIDMWARKLSDIDYLQELYIDNVDLYYPTLTITGKDGESTTQYMIPRDIGKNLDEQQRNDEKLYRRSFSYVIDVPNASPKPKFSNQLRKVNIRTRFNTDNKN